MVNASFQQTNFLGGKWSLSAQGRVDDPRYKMALAQCVNAMPKLSGQWARRPGFTTMAHTRGGKTGVLLGFHFNATDPYQIELTDNFARIYASLGLVYTSDTPVLQSISAANPAVVTLGALPATWANGDTVAFRFNSPPWTAAGALGGRQFVIQGISGNTFTIYDSLTGASIDGSTFTYTPPTIGPPDNVFKIAELATPYSNGAWTNTKLIQDSTTALLLNNLYAPQSITLPAGAFQIATQAFTDGPYFDINKTTTTITPSGTTGSITLTASALTGINNGQGFVVTDIGRLVRFQSGPGAWAGGTTYANAATVTGSDGNIYSSNVGGNIGHDPTTDTGTYWTITGTTVVWTWLQITAWTSATVVTATVMGANLASASAQTAWRLGLWSDTTGYPSCGTYHRGRFWFGGVIPNRFDASVANDLFNMSPTATDGTVGDANAISGVLNAPQVNNIVWFMPGQEGIVVGTAEGEFLICASTLNDPLTPSTTTADRISTYGCAAIDPANLTTTLGFVQTQKGTLIDYYHEGGASGWVGEKMTTDVQDIASGDFSEIRYVNIPFYTLWARSPAGALSGAVYQHAFDNHETINAWHTHVHGGSHIFISLSNGPTYNGLSQTLYAITQDPATGYCWAGAMGQPFEEGSPGWQAIFTDGIAPLTNADLKLVSSGDSFNGARLYGMADAIGKTVTPVINGYDAGTFVVQSPGYIDVPFDTIFTQASLTAFTDPLAYGPYTLPVAPKFTAYATTSLLRYNAQSLSVLGFRGLVEDWPRNRVLAIWADGIRVYNLQTGALVSTVTFATMQYGGSSASINNGYTYDHFEGMLYTHLAATNSSRLWKINPYTGKVVGVFGADSASLSPTTASRILTSGNGQVSVPYYLTRATQGVFHIQASINGVTTANAIDVIDGVRMAYVGTASVTQNKATALSYAGRSGLNTFVLAFGMDNGPTLNKIQPYKLTLNLLSIVQGQGISSASGGFGATAVTSAALGGGFTPASIDATWTHFQQCLGGMYDATDGNVIIYVTTADAVTHQAYWVKVNSSTGAVVWKTADDGNVMSGAVSYEMSQQRIPNSQFMYQFTQPVSATAFKRLNTSTGALTAVTLVASFGTMGVEGFGGLYIPEIDAAYNYWDYSAGAGAPTYLGVGYTPSGGNFSKYPALLIPNGPSAAANWPPPSQYFLPVTMGARYTSTGQLNPPDYKADAGAQNGPAFGKLRRLHWYALKLVQSGPLTIAADDQTQRNVDLQTPGGVVTAQPSLFSGVVSTTIECDDSFNGQMLWQASMAYPVTIATIGGYIQSSDK